MAKSKANVRQGSQSMFRRLTPFTILLLLGVVFCLIYVSLDSKIDHHGDELKRLDGEIRKTERLLTAEELDWARTLRPENIRRALARQGMNMDFPKHEQKIVVHDHHQWIREQTTRAGRIAGTLDSPADKHPLASK